MRTTLALFFISVASVFAQDYSVMITTNKTPSTFFPNHAARHAPGGADTLTSHYATNAPSDGTTYGMKDGDWTEVTGGGGSSTNFSFKANLGGVATNIASASIWTKISMTNELWDTHSWYDAPQGRLTVQESGKYLFNWLYSSRQIQSFVVAMSVYVNGTNTVFGGGDNTQVGGKNQVHVSAVLNLASNDYIEVYGRVNDAGDGFDGAPERTSFSGVKLTP